MIFRRNGNNASEYLFPLNNFKTIKNSKKESFKFIVTPSFTREFVFTLRSFISTTRSFIKNLFDSLEADDHIKPDDSIQ